ncbi:hypothetical protein [Jannaschia sp. LMIT008]|uniref:hypothetical protein n=1 Tax=Jannaschia maritima TaxID=3032585 RepID=UPI0028120FA8|nr:hypothetical protein [Jannaschia sp. LMIT008]
MRRWHFYIMGLVSLVWGIVSMIEYVLVSYGLEWGWLAHYPQAQIEWLESLPPWVHGVWAIHATLALVGALCLLASVRASVWMFGLSFLTFIVLVVWAHGFAAPPVWALTDATLAAAVSFLLIALSGLIWIYARSEKRSGAL